MTVAKFQSWRMGLPSIRLPIIGALIVLLVLLMGLWFKNKTLNLDRHDRIMEQVRSLKQIEAVINTDILKARFLLQAHYDPLAHDWQQYQASLEALEKALIKAQPEVTVQNCLTSLKQMIAAKGTAVEQFKTQNAVLQNSLRYFPTPVKQVISQLPPNTPLTQLLNQLLQNELIYNLNAREELHSIILTDIIALDAEALHQPPDIANDLTNIALHGRMIARLKPEVEQIINHIMTLPTAPALEALAAAHEAQHGQQMEKANVLGLLLFGMAIALLVVYVADLYHHQQKSEQLKAINLLLEKEVSDRTQTLQQTLETLQQSQSQLIQAEKMAGLGQMVAGIAHEVNNPINFIYANIKPTTQYALELLHLFQLYQQHYPHPIPAIEAYRKKIDIQFIAKDFPKILTSMKVGADRIRDLVLSLRNFSRLDEAEMKSVDLHEGLESTLLILQHRLKPQPIKIIKEYGTLPLVECYAGSLNQVFMNILSNAIDALEETTDREESLSIRILTQTLDHQHVAICIADNGAGVPEPVKQRLFDPFFTTKPVGKGTGLGLSIAYQIIVDSHQGKLWCESAQGQGTEFWIELPVQHFSHLNEHATVQTLGITAIVADGR